ncbi:Rieske 2Fe-2S domain-containing protein [uncultured Friedmanniella sp.]|uniref:Rieske 2Fe-2S domain-containing protein n=1 Tax=uncultured Friedmanniella sp. TaxID=335381 RepID=UPI0035CA44BA
MLNKLMDIATTSVEKASFLDAPAAKLAELISPVVQRPGPRHVASGTPIGHPLHPLLVAIPIGAWSSALAFDALGDDDGASTLIALGVVTALPTMYTGLSDWSYTEGAEKRVGFLHAAFNGLALSAFVASWVLRRSGRRGPGVLLSIAGMAGVSGGGWLGGHLAYAMGVGVDTTAFQHSESEWSDLADPAEIVAGELTEADLDGVPVVLTRLPDRVVAYADRCSHRGAPLHEGTVEDGCLVCPWHNAAFDLRDGSVALGPASRPQTAFEVRVSEGRLQGRRLDERSLRTNPVGR